jgi:hypothetical protein
MQLAMQQVAAQAQLEWNKEMFRLRDLPMLEIQKQQLALTAARDAANAEYQRITSGLGVLNLTAGLRGPVNAFKQQEVLHGINSLGLSNAVDAVAGRISMPATQAPQATPEPVTMANFLTSVLGGTEATPTALKAQATPATQAAAAQPTQVQAPVAGASPPIPVQPGGGQVSALPAAGTPGTPAAAVTAPTATLSKSAADYGKALPAPNKIVPEQWERLDDQTKQFLLGAYEAQGYAQEDILNYVQKAKPQFKTSAPSFGQIRG